MHYPQKILFIIPIVLLMLFINATVPENDIPCYSDTILESLPPYN
jgi:hypothetical protein